MEATGVESDGINRRVGDTDVESYDQPFAQSTPRPGKPGYVAWAATLASRLSLAVGPNDTQPIGSPRASSI